MLCKKPYLKGVMPFGCGQCMPCRLNRRRLWTHRLLLEQLKHKNSCFVTLTYNEENLPDGQTLLPKHPQDWIKRLRKAVPDKIRYFLCGEYGDHTQRPHYHAALFGLGLEYSKIIQQTWGLGFTYTGDLTKDSAAYIAGYVTKKMTGENDERLKGRHPEFARMSLRPGLGATAVPDIGNTLTSEHGPSILINNNDVPRSLKHGGRDHPLGRYLRRKLREHMGFPEKIKEENTEAYRQEMYHLFKDALKGEEISKNSDVRKEVYKKILLQQNQQKILNLETKSKLFSKKGKI